MADREVASAGGAGLVQARIEFGSNTVRSRTRSISVDGRRMWAVDQHDDGSTRLRSPIFDPTGALVASISGSVVHGPEVERFRLTTDGTSWEVWDRKLGTPVFVGGLAGDGAFHVERADFYGVNGSHVVIMDDLVVYTHCPTPPERRDVDLRTIFVLADQDIAHPDGVVFGVGGVQG